MPTSPGAAAMIFNRRSASASLPPAGQSLSVDSSYSTELMVHLNIPSHLSDCGRQSLCHLYAKYQAFLKAVETLDEKWKKKELPYTWKPTQEHIIETMQSKTFWYDYIKKYFPQVSEHSDMVAWLTEAEDAPSDFEVWGVEKAQYGFGDLDKYLKSKGKKNKKGKEKMVKSPKKQKGSESKHKGKKKEEKSPKKASK